jgi:hypothetical protein
VRAGQRQFPFDGLAQILHEMNAIGDLLGCWSASAGGLGVPTVAVPTYRVNLRMSGQPAFDGFGGVCQHVDDGSVFQVHHNRAKAHAFALGRFIDADHLRARDRRACAIMRETGLGWASVRKWIRLSDLPMRNRMAPRPGMPEFYREYLQRRWTEGCQSARVLMAEIQTLGYIGCYGGLAKLVASWRQPASATCDLLSDTAAVIHSDDSMDRDVPIQPVPVRHISPQIAAALLSQRVRC